MSGARPSKYLAVIGDGMADFAIEELGGKTPLMAAEKPHIDRVAREGFCAQVTTVPEGFPPGSDVACMSLFGYDPVRFYTGRAPIEAYGMGIALDGTDVAFRCNLVYLDVRPPRVLMGDYSAGHITTEEARTLVGDLGSAIGNEEFRFFPGVGYRHLMVWKDGEADMATIPPHDILEKEVIDYLPTGSGSKKIIRLMSDSQIFLKDHPVNRARVGRGLPPGNSIWLWGQGRRPAFPGFYETYGARGAVVAAVDLVKGIGALAGFDAPPIPGATGYLDTDYGAKARSALALLDRYDVVYIHVEAPDEASHEGSLPDKIKAIERIDEEIVGYILERIGGDVRLLVATDHATPLSLRTHYACPVPFAVFQKGQTLGPGGAYDEKNGGRMFSGEQMVAFFMKGSEL
ncbi:MAG: cofactor-independent phosphoglycerate mutase [Syntrophorhabdales bacterium]|jgi:2,3-bisphosphoglycerate-independent phosphoglycerate mutase